MQVALPMALRTLRPRLCHFTNSVAPLAAPRPFVLTLHDMSLFLYPRTQPRKSRLLIRPLIPAAARRAAAIITDSASARRDILARLKVPPDRVQVIYAAAAPEYRVVDAPDVLERTRRRYHLDQPYVLHVGTLEPRKNIPRLLEAFARARRHDRRMQLLLAGQPGWNHAPLGALVERLDLAGSVRFLGFVPEADLPALYTLARATAFPSLYEGFGLPIVESMACGTPVLTADRAATAEVAGPAALLADPMRIDALADGLVAVTTDGALRTRLRAAGLARAASFSWQKVAEQTAAVYRRVSAVDAAGDLKSSGATEQTSSGRAESHDLEVA